MSYIKGMDISHQVGVDWARLDANVKFVYCKATQGIGFKDPAFNGYWQYLKGTGLFRGAYHFLSVEGSAEQQADNFLSRGVDFSKPNVLPPMLDVEDQVGANDAETAHLNGLILANKAAFIQLTTDWINIVQQKTGRKVVIYSYKNFFHEYLNDHSWPGSYLWLASYQPNPPGLPEGYRNWDFWQYAQYGTIDGRFTYDKQQAKTMGADLDLDYYAGTPGDLAKL